LGETRVAGQGIDLSWNSVTDAHSYTLEKSTDDSNWSVIVTTSETSYSDYALHTGTTYYYRILASNGIGTSSFSAPVSATTQLYLRATKASSSQIDLGWVSGTGISSYTVERSIDGSNWQAVATTSGTSYNDTGLAPNTTYYYKIVASNGAFSPPVSATTMLQTPVVTAPEVSSSQINLSWNSVSGATFYRVYESRDNKSWNYIGESWGTTFPAEGLLPNTGYFFLVGADNPSNFSDVTDVPAVTLPATPSLTATTGSTASSESNAYINLSLSFNNNNPFQPINFMLERSLDGTNWQVIFTTLGNQVSYTDSGLNSDTIYYYLIVADNGWGSSPSAPVSAVSSMSADEHYVLALYQDFLGRNGSKAEWDGWANQISSIGQQGVANQIARSTEALDRFVNQINLAFLARPADSGGESYWVSQLQSGQTEVQFMSQILGSTELYSDLNANTTNFVNYLYEVVLKRPADSGGLSYWTYVLNSGLENRAQVAYTFLTRGEFRTDAV
jgi:titin